VRGTEIANGIPNTFPKFFEDQFFVSDAISLGGFNGRSRRTTSECAGPADHSRQH
jgi:hypothetical protein